MPPLPPPPPPGLRAVFDQWDINANGKLELSELKRALLAVGLDPEAIAEALVALGTDGGITYDELEARLPPGPRASIEARLNQDGVMESLYVPPEKVWPPCLPNPRPRRCANRFTCPTLCHAVGGRHELGGPPARPADPVRCAPERKRAQPE